MTASSQNPEMSIPNDPYAALRIPQYRLFTLGRNLSGFGDSMQSVAIGWELYARTRDPMTLGYVGLFQAAPILLFALFAGHVADRFPRKIVAVIAQCSFSICTLLIACLSSIQGNISLFYLCLFSAMSARAFGNPARGAILPQIVPAPMLANAISWDTSVRRIAVMSGAAMGGLLIEWSGRRSIASHLTHFMTAVHSTAKSAHTGYPAVVYVITALFGFASAGIILSLSFSEDRVLRKEPTTWATLIAGVHYIRGTRIVLATITLDLLAVLFGGATSLLPIYASDILHVGPRGLGVLRGVGSLGALFTAIAMAHIPSIRRPGRVMLWAVIGFGFATIVFGYSRSMILSLVALALIGALDMVSVVVRQTLLQTLTPNAMRGRVNAINAIFVNSSNEIGGYESGLVASHSSPVFSVVSGGIASILVTMYAAHRWPALKDYDAQNVNPEESGEPPV